MNTTCAEQFLVTYRCERTGKGGGFATYGMIVVKDPIKFLEEVQKYENEIYILINQLPLSHEEAQRIDGELKGM